MTKNKVLVIANTVFQLYTAICIKMMYLMSDDVDLILTDKTIMFKELCKSEYLKTLFKHVYYADTSKIRKGVWSKSFRGVSIIWNSLKVDRMLARERLPRYDELYTSNLDEFFRILLPGIVKKNSEIKYHLYMDGIINYIRDNNVYLIDSLTERTKKDEWYYSNLLNYKLPIKIDDMYMFAPEWIAYASSIPIKPVVRPDQSLNSLINKIFNFQDLKLPEQKFIFFDESNDFIEDVQKYNLIIDHIAQVVGYDNFILKPHPRSSLDSKGLINILKSNVPWELYAMNFDLSNKILISFHSSACTNSVVIFQQECKCCLLYKMSQDIFKTGVAYSDFLDYFSEKMELCFTPYNEVTLNKYLKAESNG